MSTDKRDERAVEALFESARDAAPELDAAFMDQLMPPIEAAPAPAPVPTSGFRMRDWLSALGGLGMATALGVWIGVAVPIDSLLGIDILTAGDALDLSAFYAGADPLVFFSDETGI